MDGANLARQLPRNGGFSGSWQAAEDDEHVWLGVGNRLVHEAVGQVRALKALKEVQRESLAGPGRVSCCFNFASRDALSLTRAMTSLVRIFIA
jgi:hypothetical protein